LDLGLPTVGVGGSIPPIRDGIREFIEDCLQDHGDNRTVIMAPTIKLRDQLAKQIRESGLNVATVNHRERLSRKDARIFAMTLHRAKGLEFDAVAILVNRELDVRLRKLVYVGMSRAKRMARLYTALT
jgi:superfamily I DNA/RNA helicase